VTLKPGTLDDTSWLEPGGHFWTSTKQPWVAIGDAMPHHATQPV
jgi:hypothetical protein